MMNDTVVIQVGASKQSWNLRGGYQIASILIDNPTGCWLFIPQDNTYVRPFTLGFAHTFSPTVARVDVLFAAIGPDTTESVIIGDPFTAMIADTPVGNSEGQHFTPIIRTRAINAATVGSNITNAAFIAPNVGRYIAAVRVDNPNGAWRQLTYGGLTAYIPPYAIAWYLRLPNNILTVSLNFLATGPAGEISTQAGDVATLTLFDQIPEGVDTSGKPSSFIEHFTPVLIAVNATQQVPFTTGLAGTLVAAIANRRMRLLTLDARLGFSNVAGIYPVCGLNFVVQDSSGSGQALIGRLSPAKPSSERAYPAGVDFALGASVIFSAAADWADLLMLLSITYQVI